MKVKYFSFFISVFCIYSLFIFCAEQNKKQDKGTDNGNSSPHTSKRFDRTYQIDDSANVIYKRQLMDSIAESDKKLFTGSKWQVYHCSITKNNKSYFVDKSQTDSLIIIFTETGDILNDNEYIGHWELRYSALSDTIIVKSVRIVNQSSRYKNWIFMKHNYLYQFKESGKLLILNGIDSDRKQEFSCN